MITVEKPDEDRLNREGVFGWPVWEKEVSEFPWEYDMQEVCYICQRTPSFPQLGDIHFPARDKESPLL